MGFEKILLSKTSFYNLICSIDVDDFRVPKKDKNWHCAQDKENKIIFTQLVSTIPEMREHIYYYFLFIDTDPVLISWAGKADFINKEILNKYNRNYLIKVVNEAAAVIYQRDISIFCY